MSDTPLCAMWRQRLESEEFHERMRQESLAEVAYKAFGGEWPKHWGPKPPSLWQRLSAWFGK